LILKEKKWDEAPGAHYIGFTNAFLQRGNICKGGVYKCKCIIMYYLFIIILLLYIRRGESCSAIWEQVGTGLKKGAFEACFLGENQRKTGIFKVKYGKVKKNRDLSAF